MKYRYFFKFINFVKFEHIKNILHFLETFPTVEIYKIHKVYKFSNIYEFSKKKIVNLSKHLRTLEMLSITFFPFLKHCEMENVFKFINFYQIRHLVNFQRIFQFHKLLYFCQCKEIFFNC